MFFVRLLLLGGIFLNGAINAGKPLNHAARRFRDRSDQLALVIRYSHDEFKAIYHSLSPKLKAEWLKANPIFNPKWTKKEQLTKLNDFAATLIAGEDRTKIEIAVHLALEKLNNKKSPKEILSKPAIELVSSPDDTDDRCVPDSWEDLI